jgi:hypothetical protein
VIKFKSWVGNIKMDLITGRQSVINPIYKSKYNYYILETVILSSILHIFSLDCI